MVFLPQEVIAAKRDGRALSGAEIAAFVSGIGEGRVDDAQIAAFAMAVFFRGMGEDEAVALTLAMRDSGEVLSWPGLDRPILDKHSTGGIGDNVSLMLAPIVAACGGAVPMISGRGLGHTGGTLDKMESIPGYRIAPDEAVLRRTMREAGCAIVGPTGRLAPADKRIYGVRDVTATVESIPLITASILSKKLAAGLECLVLDVKTGSGAFMASGTEARALADSLVRVANGAGLRTAALITDMGQALASDAGNAVEVRNAVRFLTGAQRDPRLLDVVLELAGEVLSLGGLAGDAGEGRRLALKILDDGSAAAVFARMVACLGGPADFVERMETHLPRAAVTIEARSSRAGAVSEVDARALGLAVVALGGGRTAPGDAIDHGVGLTALVPVGRRMERGEALCLVHARSQDAAEEAVRRVHAAYRLSDDEPDPRPVILGRVSA